MKIVAVCSLLLSGMLLSLAASPVLSRAAGTAGGHPSDVGQAPVHFSRCDSVPMEPAQYRYDENGHRIQQSPAEKPYIKYSFVNRSTLTATRVILGLESRGYLIERVTDVGTFSPHVPIQNHKHEFAFGRFRGGMPIVRCVALEVDLEGGKTWQNPSPPPI